MTSCCFAAFRISCNWVIKIGTDVSKTLFTTVIFAILELNSTPEFEGGNSSSLRKDGEDIKLSFDSGESVNEMRSSLVESACIGQGIASSIEASTLKDKNWAAEACRELYS